MIFQVLTIAFACPWWANAIPAAAKAVVCASSPRSAGAYDNLPDAVSKLHEIGPGAVLQACHGDKCVDLKIDWTPVVKP